MDNNQVFNIRINKEFRELKQFLSKYREEMLKRLSNGSHILTNIDGYDILGRDYEENFLLITSDKMIITNEWTNFYKVRLEGDYLLSAERIPRDLN